MDAGKSQLAIVGAKLKALYEPEAKERHNDAGRSVGADLPEQDHGRARDKAASSVGVSPRLVDDDATVLKHGVPELVKAIESGEVSAADDVRIAHHFAAPFIAWVVPS